MAERMYKLAELEELLSVSRSTLLRWIRRGRLGAIKLGAPSDHPGFGHAWSVSESDLRKFQGTSGEDQDA